MIILSRTVTKEFQDAMLIQVALHRKTRIELASEVGLSEFTLRKVLDSKTPVLVNDHTFKVVDNWLQNVKQ